MSEKKRRISLLMVQTRERAERSIAYRLERHAKAVAEGHPGHPDNAWGLADQMVGQILAHGPAYTRELYLPVAETIKGSMPALAASQLEYEINSATTEALTLALICQSLELPIGDDPTKELRPLLQKVGWIDDTLPFVNWRRGQLALAIGDADVWRSVALLHAPKPLLFTPGLKFEFNCQGLLGYLGAAVANGASFADVEVAYRDYLFCFPTLRTMRETRFENLFLIAVIVHHLIGKHPLIEVPALLQADHLANLEPPPGTVVY